MSMKITSKGQVTIPPEMRRKHRLLPRHEVEFVDQPNGVMVDNHHLPGIFRRTQEVCGACRFHAERVRFEA